MNFPAAILCLMFLGWFNVQALPQGEIYQESKTDLLNACKTLYPNHTNKTANLSYRRQTGAFPYLIQTNVTQIKPLDRVQVTLSGINGATFKGFMMQARNGDKIYGKFEKNNSIELLDCLSGEENTATIRFDVNSEDKSSVVLIWIAPAQLPEHIEFVTTVSKDFSTFWVAEKSQLISASNSSPNLKLPITETIFITMCSSIVALSNLR